MTARDNPLAWRAERALRRAWPALEECACGDWLARVARGVSRRANSANPTRAAPRNIDADIAACEQLYRARRLPTIFRLPSIIAGTADARLARLNYVAEGQTLTLYADLAPAAGRDLEVEISPRPDAQWLAATAQWQGQTAEQSAIYRRIVESLAVPAGFARIGDAGEWAAVAYGAVHDGLLCCESVITDPARRGRGFARRILAALLAWGAARDARGVCLQVAAANEPAIALYRALGLKTGLYRYHYRREPASA